MSTAAISLTRDRMADSGGIRLLARESSIKAAVVRADISDVRLPLGSYRIVLHCRNAGLAVKTEKTFPNR